MHTRSSAKRANLTSTSKSLTGSEQAQIITPDIAGAVPLDDATFARSLYRDLATDSSIDIFLKKSRSYSKKERRWKLPQNCARLFNRDFCTPVRSVVSSIMKHFWTGAEGKREVVDTHSTDLQHNEGDPVTHKSRPSLVIAAEGPSFQLPRKVPELVPSTTGFSNITSCIAVNHDRSQPQDPPRLSWPDHDTACTRCLCERATSGSRVSLRARQS